MDPVTYRAKLTLTVNILNKDPQHTSAGQDHIVSDCNQRLIHSIHHDLMIALKNNQIRNDQIQNLQTFHILFRQLKPQFHSEIINIIANDSELMEHLSQTLDNLRVENSLEPQDFQQLTTFYQQLQSNTQEQVVDSSRLTP